MNHLRFDLRDVLRGLRRDAAYTATAVLTLALTIGATTAVFSIVNGVLLRPLKYRESHQLVTIREVEVELLLTAFACLVGNVASLAAHIERCVPTAVLRNVHTFVMAA